MSLDYSTILISVGFSAAGLALAVLGGWLLVRSERFMLTWAVALVFIVGNVMTYGRHISAPSPLMAWISMVFLMIGFSIIYGASVQFVRGVSPVGPSVRAAIPFVIGVSIPMVFGLDGIGFFIENAGAAILFFMTGMRYWTARDEAPVAITAIGVLHGIVGLSFALCALMIALGGEIVLTGPPQNWAEDLSLVAGLIGMTGIGALSLSLTQWRLGARHRRDARTDPLTGLLNRRALFELFGSGPIEVGTAVIVFDLDHFKQINDGFGHAAGDEVLRRFAEMLLRLAAPAGPAVRAARLGGEEFVLILPATPKQVALQMADLVRRRFASEVFEAAQGTMSCTASAGVAVAEGDSCSFEATLNAADRALYEAKSAGRDRTFPAPRPLLL